MKKLSFPTELKEGLKNLHQRLGPGIPGDKLSKVVGGYCGGTCYITCSWYCRGDSTSEEIAVPNPPID